VPSKENVIDLTVQSARPQPAAGSVGHPVASHCMEMHSIARNG